MAKSKPKASWKLSILTPFYNESKGIAHYFDTMVPLLKNLCPDYEVICVDDGSSDDTFAKLQAIAKLNPNVKLVKFSRNFGKEAALSAALDHSTGDAVIPMDADLQDPPSALKDMIIKWREGYEVVNAIRKTRAESFFKKFPALMYHKFMSLLTDGKIPANVGDFRLLDRKVVEQIKNLHERTRYMKGIFSWVGFKKADIFYHRPERKFGETKLGFFKLLRLGYDGIFSFSSKPLKIWLYVGVIFSLIALTYAGYLIHKTLAYGVDLPGYASIMVAVLFMGGVQLMSLGILGEYIARIFKEVKQRPIYIVDEKYGFETSAKSKPAKTRGKKVQKTQKR